MLDLKFKIASDVKQSLIMLKNQTNKKYFQVIALGVGLTTSLAFLVPVIGAFMLAPLCLSFCFTLVMILFFVFNDMVGFPSVRTNQLGTVFFKSKPSIINDECNFIKSEMNTNHYDAICDIYTFYLNYKIQTEKNIEVLNELKKVKEMIDFNQLSLAQAHMPEKVKKIIEDNHQKIYQACVLALNELYQNRNKLEKNPIDMKTFSEKLSALENEENSAAEFIENIYQKMPKAQNVSIKHNKTLSL